MSVTEDVTLLDLVHLVGAEHDLDRTTANALSDGPASDQRAALFTQLEALQLAALLLGNDGLRTRLHDVQLAVIAIQRPFDIHGPLVMLLDGDRLTGEVHDLLVVDTETPAILVRHVNGFHGTTCAGILAVYHLDQLRPQGTAQHGGAPSGQRGLVHIELVRVDRALHHGLAQPQEAVTNTASR